jgi:hypothetical protein
MLQVEIKGHDQKSVREGSRISAISSTTGRVFARIVIVA